MTYEEFIRKNNEYQKACTNAYEEMNKKKLEWSRICDEKKVFVREYAESQLNLKVGGVASFKIAQNRNLETYAITIDEIQCTAWDKDNTSFYVTGRKLRKDGNPSNSNKDRVYLDFKVTDKVDLNRIDDYFYYCVELIR